MAKSANIKERFLKKVQKTDSCWLWAASKNNWGYGQFNMNGKMQRSHRVSYELFIGEIPDGLFVCHSCDTPACVNPDHLWIGSHADNTRDKMKKGRHVSAVGEKHWSRTQSEKVPRGEEHSNSKLTETQVLKIREKYATGKYSHRGLGKEFDVDSATIGRIIRRTQWKHLGVME